jgi:hypothetical protein
MPTLTAEQVKAANKGVEELRAKRKALADEEPGARPLSARERYIASTPLPKFWFQQEAYYKAMPPRESR